MEGRRVPRLDHAQAVSRLLIASKFADTYRRLIGDARLPDLDITTDAAIADIAFGEPSLIAPDIDRLRGVRWVQSTWAGVEPLLDPTRRRDYVLTNARGVFGPQMSEYVFAYVLAHERHLIEKFRAQQERRWDPAPPGMLPGKTIGLLGVGTIGAAIARTAKHFGMRVKGFTRASETSADVDEYFHGDDRGAFARDLDYLVAVMPNTAKTRHLVDADLLAALPPHAVFINPGRGSTVDEDALAAALRAKRIAGAVLDVFHQEPLPPDHVFWTLPNVLITSHTAALSFPELIAPIFIDNYRRFVNGQPLRYVVDFRDEY